MPSSSSPPMEATPHQDATAAVNRHSARAVNSGIELANTVLAIVKEVGEMLNNVPYVKSLSGVILQIIKIRDEIKANKERCGQIIDKALRMSKWVYEKLVQIARSNQREKLAALEVHLNQHESALDAVYAELEKHQSGRSFFSKLTNRGLDELNEHDKHLDELNSQLMLDIMFHNTIEQAASSSVSTQLASTDIAMRYLTLAESHVEKQQWFKAIETYTVSLEAYKQVPNLRRQAEIGNIIIELHLDYHDIAEAEKVAIETLAAATQANHAVEVGNVRFSLGRLYAFTERIMDARQCFEEALRIFRQENIRISQLGTVKYLGEVYIQLDQLSMAEEILTASSKVELDVAFIPQIITILGWLYICSDYLDKAEPLLYNALKRFQKTENKSWQAEVLAHLGNLYLKSNRLDKVEQVLKSVLTLAPSHIIKIYRLWILGNLYTAQGKLEDAEASLDEATACCRDTQSSLLYQRGNILRSMGILHMKRGHVALALEKFQEAGAFHRKAQWVSEQATDLKRLGEACKMLGRTEEAVAAFMEAEVLMETVRKARTLKA